MLNCEFSKFYDFPKIKDVEDAITAIERNIAEMELKIAACISSDSEKQKYLRKRILNKEEEKLILMRRLGKQCKFYSYVLTFFHS